MTNPSIRRYCPLDRLHLILWINICQHTMNILSNRSLTYRGEQILWCFLRMWRADISVLSQVRILYVNEKEKRYKWNIMFLFAGHSDKPLKSLISIAHKENNICLYRFSFIYAVNDLWEDAYTCPINVMNRTTKSAIYVMELTVMGWVPIKRGNDKIQSDSSDIVSTTIT